MEENGNVANEIVKVAAEEPQMTNRQQAALEPYSPEYETPARRPSEQRNAAFNPVAWLVDGATGVVEELRHNDLGLSENFWVHLYAARRESLLAARALVDSLIARTDTQLREEQAREQRRDRRGGIDIAF